MHSHHPSSDKVSHPRSHSSNLHEALIPDAHVLCHHVRPARKEHQFEEDIKNVVYVMRAVKTGGKSKAGRRLTNGTDRGRVGAG